MSINLSSNTLFHYTDFECLMKILEEGFKPNHSLENFEFLFDKENNIKNNHFIPMVSFCDIPISSSKKHIFTYDKYAIGLSRKWGEDNGLNPVMYISRNSKVINNFRYAYSNYNDIVIEIEEEKEVLYNKLKKSKFEDLEEVAINEISKKLGKKITNQNFEVEIKNYTMKCFCEDYLWNQSYTLDDIHDKIFYKDDMTKKRIYKLLDIASSALKYILFIKPYTNKTETKIFYDEKEWRYVPDVLKQLIECPDEVVSEVENSNSKDGPEFKRELYWLNKSVKHPLKFSSSDIRYIIVKDKMKSKMIDFLMKSSKYREDYLLNNFIVLTISQIKEDM